VITTYPDQVHSALITVPLNSIQLSGDLSLPDGAEGMVVFAHGSGSSRKSPRNCYVAQMLQEAGLATFLVDLLTAQEEVVDSYTRHLRFDIPLLAQRLVGVTDWLSQFKSSQDLKIGYFGASTGSAAAIIAASNRPGVIKAIVSRGGRPDLAASALARVDVPTLLIVGGRDPEVLSLNRIALEHLKAEKALQVIPGATHLFEELGALEQVAQLARVWFLRYLTGQDRDVTRS
jgi:dienelactone hydrolase